MPNPTRGIKRTDMRRLSARQKGIVRQLRRAKLPVKVYKRGKKLSVHNPFLDIRRRAMQGSAKQTKKYPHARDTAMQRRVRVVKKTPKGARKVRSVRRLLLP